MMYRNKLLHYFYCLKKKKKTIDNNKKKSQKRYSAIALDKFQIIHNKNKNKNKKSVQKNLLAIFRLRN